MGDYEMKVVLVGNPGAGKRVMFNRLTGPRHHGGNRGRASADGVRGEFTYGQRNCLVVDMPGVYSLSAGDGEGERVRQYLCLGEADAVVTVVDAMRLERGLYLLKQILSLEPIRDRGVSLILCVDGCENAEKRGIQIDFDLLRDVLQFPVIPWDARRGEDLVNLKEAILEWGKVKGCYECLDFSPGQLARETVGYTRAGHRRREELMDRIVTGRFTGSLLLVVLLMSVFWLTAKGAAYPSRLLWRYFFALENRLTVWLSAAGVPDVLVQAAVCGVYRACAWVTAIMLPPAAVFFWLFALLEDSGYLSRVAFSMDRPLRGCRACGGQCLTMALGAGCGCAGVAGCRAIDSPRERLTAILTNSLMPCSGRFPTLLMLGSLFLIPGFPGNMDAFLLTSLFLTAVVVAGAAAGLACSWLLSSTLLKGFPSVFTMELPPYRCPEAGRILVRSLRRSTLPVMSRAAAAAAFGGLAVWLMTVWSVGGQSILFRLTTALEPAGRLIGLDGVILAAFLLSFPANEMVVPVMVTAYLQRGYMAEVTDFAALQALLVNNGWTWKTALCMAVFAMFHWPCLSVCLAVKRETKSLRWTGVAAAVPTLLGVLLCAVINGVLIL